jgi:hypothetical protein
MRDRNQQPLKHTVPARERPGGGFRLFALKKDGASADRITRRLAPQR